MSKVIFEHVGHLWEPSGHILTIVSDENSFLFKLLILGDIEVGKTSLVSCFRGEGFQLFYPEVTLGGGLGSTFLTFFEGLKVFFTHLERPVSFNYMKGANYKKFYRYADGALLIFDCSRPATAKTIVKQAAELFHHINGKVAMVVVGNKIDLREKYPEAMSSEEGFQIAETIRKQKKSLTKVPYIETSAKNNININTVFQTLWAQIYEKSGDESKLGAFFSVRKSLNYDGEYGRFKGRVL